MRRLSRLFSRTSVSTPAVIVSEAPGSNEHDVWKISLLNLPVEILLLIDSYLNYEHATCLSLTCKKAYGLFFDRNKSTRRRHSRDKQFLFLLERDYPELLTCPVHEILYAWQKQKNNRYQCQQRCRISDSMVICNKGCEIGSSQGIFDAERRLMIRRAFLGPEYGISMRLLDHVCKRSRSDFVNEVTPRVAGKSLMIWRIHNHTVPIDFASWTEISIGRDFDEAICVHSERDIRALVVSAILHARRRWQHIRQLVEPKRNYMNDLVGWRCPMLFKCPRCPTDVRLRMDYISSNTINVRLDVFQDLGGLDQISVPRYQRLGTRLRPNVRYLDRRDRIQRLRENLESRYFGRSEVAERYCQDIPWNTALLGQWWYHFSYRLDDPDFTFTPDVDIPKPIWEGYQKIRFKEEPADRAPSSLMLARRSDSKMQKTHRHPG